MKGLSASGRDFRLRAPQFRKSRYNSHCKVDCTGEDDGCGTSGKVRADDHGSHDCNSNRAVEGVQPVPLVDV